MFKAQVVNFCGIDIPTFQDESGRVWVAVKPVIEGIGLDWNNQHEKLMYRADEFEPTELPIKHETRSYNTICIPLDNLNGFLFSINFRRIKNEVVQAKVRHYQQECQNSLRDYWLYGISVNPRETPYEEESPLMDFGKSSRQRLKHFINLFAEKDPDVIKYLEDRIDVLLKTSIGTSNLNDLEGLDVIRLATTQEIISRSVAACWRGQLNLCDGLALIESWTQEGVRNLGNQLMVMQVVFQRDDGSCF